MKNIKIYVKGNYDYYYKLSTWSYYLNYNDYVLKSSNFTYEDGTLSKSLLHGIYEALQRVKEPCIIDVYTPIRLGFSKPKFSEHKTLMLNIMNTMIKAGHVIRYHEDSEMSQVDIWEQLYGTPIHYEKHELQTAKPDIENKKDANDVFSTDDKIKVHDLNSLYDDDDLFGNKWVPGSGGY